MKMHEDATVDSSIFNFRISFFWRPLLNGALDDLLRLWNTSPYSETPTLILIGK